MRSCIPFFLSAQHILPAFRSARAPLRTPSAAAVPPRLLSSAACKQYSVFRAQPLLLPAFSYSTPNLSSYPFFRISTLFLTPSCGFNRISVAATLMSFHMPFGR